MTFNEILKSSRKISGEFSNRIFANSLKIRISNFFENTTNSYLREISERIGNIVNDNYGEYKYYFCSDDKLPQLSEEDKKELLLMTKETIEKEVELYSRNIKTLLGVIDETEPEPQKSEPQNDISITIEKITPQELFGGER